MVCVNFLLVISCTDSLVESFSCSSFRNPLDKFSASSSFLVCNSASGRFSLRSTQWLPPVSPPPYPFLQSSAPCCCGYSCTMPIGTFANVRPETLRTGYIYSHYRRILAASELILHVRPRKMVEGALKKKSNVGETSGELTLRNKIVREKRGVGKRSGIKWTSGKMVKVRVRMQAMCRKAWSRVKDVIEAAGMKRWVR